MCKHDVSLLLRDKERRLANRGFYDTIGAVGRAQKLVKADTAKSYASPLEYRVASRTSKSEELNRGEQHWATL